MHLRRGDQVPSVHDERLYGNTGYNCSSVKAAGKSADRSKKCVLEAKGMTVSTLFR